MTSRERIRWCLEEGLADAVISAHLLQRRLIDGRALNNARLFASTLDGENLSNLDEHWLREARGKSTIGMALAAVARKRTVLRASNGVP